MKPGLRRILNPWREMRVKKTISNMERWLFCPPVLLSVFTAVFFFTVRYLRLILPFLLGTAAFGLSRPLQRLLTKHSRMSSRTAGKTALCLVFAAGSVCLLSLLFLLIFEIRQLLGGRFESLFHALHPRVQTFLSRVIGKFPELLQKAEEHMEAVLPYMQGLLHWLLSLPALGLVPTLLFLTASFLLRKQNVIRRGVLRLIGTKPYKRLRKAWGKQSKTSFGFMNSYLLIYLITFSEALLIILLLHRPYPVITALFVTMSDFIPVLGPGTVLLPLAVYAFLCGELSGGIGLIFGWILITVIRQIIEPKLLSDVMRTPPLFMLAAVYLSLLTGNFWLIPYTMLSVWLWHFLKDAGFETFFKNRPETEAEQS